MSTNKIDMAIKGSEMASNGLRRYTVSWLNSERPPLTTNELPAIMNAIKHSRYSGLLNYSLAFVERDEPFDPDDFHGTLTLLCKYGKDDITGLLRQSDIGWQRYSEDADGNARTGSDAIWNILHDAAHWPSGRTRLSLQPSDIDGQAMLPTVLRFTATVTIRDGRGNALGRLSRNFEPLDFESAESIEELSFNAEVANLNISAL